MKSKIGWCNLTWNPVWGCLNICPYCYARAIAKRFWKQRYMEECNYHFNLHPDWVWTGDHLLGLQSFKPTWLDSKFGKKFPRKPQKIFVGSMSEIKYWKNEWMEGVLEKIRKYPQHVFQFLTKFPGVYLWYRFPVNCWLGITITDTKDYDQTEYYKFKVSNPDNLKFICFEPLLNNISLNLEGVNWVILGAETGTRKGKIIPKIEWSERILWNYLGKIPIYIKDNLTKYYPKYERYKQFPTIKKL